MRYPGWANIICTDKAIGNAMAQLIDPDGGATTFGSIELSGPSGIGYATSVPLTQEGLILFAEFATAGPWPMLEARGATAQQIEAAKAVMLMEFGARETYERGLSAFIASNGYELIPRA